jgi:hypothetical protein
MQTLQPKRPGKYGSGERLHEYLGRQETEMRETEK